MAIQIPSGIHISIFRIQTVPHTTDQLPAGHHIAFGIEIIPFSVDQLPFRCWIAPRRITEPPALFSLNPGSGGTADCRTDTSSTAVSSVAAAIRIRCVLYLHINEIRKPLNIPVFSGCLIRNSYLLLSARSAEIIFIIQLIGRQLDGSSGIARRRISRRRIARCGVCLLYTSRCV